MKSKLVIAIFSLIVSVMIVLYIFSVNNQKSLLGIQLPLLLLFIYLSAAFGTSHYFDRVKQKAIQQKKENINPYKLLIKFNTMLNILIFGVFGFITLFEILILITLYN